MIQIIKITRSFDNWGDTNTVKVFGSFSTEEEAVDAISADVKKISKEWEDYELPEVSIRKIGGRFIGRGFRFNDDEEGDVDYANNEWVYIISE